MELTYSIELTIALIGAISTALVSLVAVFKLRNDINRLEEEKETNKENKETAKENIQISLVTSLQAEIKTLQERVKYLESQVSDKLVLQKKYYKLKNKHYQGMAYLVAINSWIDTKCDKQKINKPDIPYLLLDDYNAIKDLTDKKENPIYHINDYYNNLNEED